MISIFARSKARSSAICTLHNARSLLSNPLNLQRSITLNSAIHNGLRADKKFRRNRQNGGFILIYHVRSNLSPAPLKRVGAFDENSNWIPRHHATSDLIFGRNAVLAALKSNRRVFYQLYRLAPSEDRVIRTDEKPSEAAIEDAAKSVGIETKVVDRSWIRAFQRVSGDAPHNVSRLKDHDY